MALATTPNFIQSVGDGVGQWTVVSIDLCETLKSNGVSRATLTPQWSTISLPMSPASEPCHLREVILCQFSAFSDQGVFLAILPKGIWYIHSRMYSLFLMMSFSKIRKCSPNILYAFVYLHLICLVCTFPGRACSVHSFPLGKKYVHPFKPTLSPWFRPTIPCGCLKLDLSFSQNQFFSPNVPDFASPDFLGASQ